MRCTQLVKHTHRTLLLLATRLLLALAYVTLLAIVALGVPLALNLRDRVDSEVRAQARSQADVVAATASDLLDPASRARLHRLTATAADTVSGRVLVVSRNGRVLSDSAGCVPVPLSMTVWGESAASSVNVSVPVRLPVCVGVNVTPTMHVPLGATGALEHVSDEIAKSPEILTGCSMFRFAVPRGVQVVDQ